MTTRIKMHSPPKEEKMPKDAPNNIAILLAILIICGTIITGIYIISHH